MNRTAGHEWVLEEGRGAVDVGRCNVLPTRRNRDCYVLLVPELRRSSKDVARGERNGGVGPGHVLPLGTLLEIVGGDRGCPVVNIHHRTAGVAPKVVTAGPVVCGCHRGCHRGCAVGVPCAVGRAGDNEVSGVSG